MMMRTRNQTGFTLLEIIVSMAIVALISTVLLASLNIGFKAKKSANAGVSGVRSAKLAMELVGHDFRGALVPRDAFIGSFMATQISQTESSVTFFNTSDAIRPTDGASDIEEVTLAMILPADLQLPASAQNNSVSNGFSMPDPVASADGKLLVRRVRRQLLAPVQQVAEDQILCRDVRTFSLRFYDGSQWMTSWDSTGQGGVIPVAVEVTVEILDVDPANGSTKSSHIFTRIFRIPCGVPSNTTGTTGATTG